MMMRSRLMAMTALALSAVMAWPQAGSAQAPALAVVAPATVTPATVAPATAPMEFRRVFVPADRTADWPTGGAQYLPLARDEFERLVKQAEERRQLEKSGGAQLVEARYAARLTESELLDGVAEFEVALVEDTPCVVSLEPWNAVLMGGRWIRDAANEETEPATLGLWADDEGPAATYGVLASQSGKIEIDWQAAAERRGDELEFVLRLPTAVTQRLTLDLPVGFAPTITSGRLVEQAATTKGAGRLWQFQLAAGVEHRLTIRRPVEARAAADAAALPLAAVTEAYRLTTDGADYEAELRLQRRGAPLTELRLQAPPTLHVASVAVNREPVEWRRDAEDAATLIVSLPANNDGSQAPVIVAISGAAAVTFDAAWKLPSVVPQNVFWTEGTSTLWVDPTLEIRSLTPRECSLLNVVGVGSGDAGEVYRLQAWSPAASAELVVGEHRRTLRHRSGVAVEFADREVVAVANATLWSDGGRTFHIAAPLGDQWSVESVTAVPSDALAEWHVEEGEIRSLHVQLRRSPTAALPVTITATARKPWRAWTRMATVGELDFLQLPGAAEGRWLLAKDRRGNELVPDAKLAEATVASADLPLAAQELLGAAPQGLAIDLSGASPGGLISVASSAVEFNGEAWMEASALAAGYEHRTEILCRPTAGSVSELRVLAARELPADVAWELADGTAVVVDRITPAASGATTATTSAAMASAPVEYRVRLPQPRTAPFRLRAAWRSAAPADAAVNLLSLPDAATWQAWAIFRGQPNQVTVDARGAATAVALPPQASASEMPAIACLRLGDDPSGVIATPPTFVLAASNGGAAATAAAAIQQTGAVAWQCDAATEQLADGTQNHRVDYRIEAREPTEVQLSLARSGTSFTAIVLDGRTVLAAPAPETRMVRFRLPGSPRLQELTVSLQGKSEPLGRSAKIWPTLPRTSFPVLHGHWTLRWPVAYDATTMSAAGAGPEIQRAESTDWLARLGGPLAGHGGQRWYDGMLLAHIDAASTGYASSPDGATTPGGWNSLTQAFVDRPAPVSLRLASSEQANWHVAWLAAAVASGWLWARSRRSVVLLVGAVAAVCLVAPERFIPLPQAAFLGLVTGAIVRQCVSFLTKPRAARGSESGNAATLAVSLLCLATFIAQWSGVAPAACAQAPALPPQVLFPVDSEGKPAGDDVYVPALMAAELLPAASGAPAALVDAHYLVDVQPSAVGGEAAPRQVELRFRWQTERPQCRVELPLARADGAIDPATLLLNGQPVAAVWNEAGTALALVLPQAGRQELTAALVPAPAAGHGVRSRLQLHVPRVAGATVEVVHPAGLSDLRLAGGAPTAGAPTAGAPSAARTLFRLGPEPLLDLTWASRLDREATGVAVEQLSALEVDPVAARLDVRLRLSGDATGVQSLRLALSPQLKLLPLPEGSPLELAPAAGGESPGVVELRFRSPPALPLTLSLQFQVQRTLSVGRIDYPWVDVLGMNVRTRHLVVVADPRLRVRDAVAAGMTAVAASELETAWGAAAAGAALRYAVTTPAPAWALDVAPLPPRFTSRESLELRCGDEEIHFVYSAAIADVDGELLAHRFNLPADLIVDRVTATVDGAAGDVPVRWARPQGNQLQLFLSRPLSESHLVRIEGRVNAAITATTAAAVDAGMTPAVERHLEVPRIGIEVAAATPIDLLLFRSSDVLVDWASSAPAAKPAAGALDPAAGLFVGQYALPRGDGATAELRIVPNSARYEADALLTMQLDAVQPTAACRIEGRGTEGTVDRLRLLVGKNWRGPFTCDPAARVVNRELAANAELQTLEVQLAKPVAAGEALSITIEGPVSLETDQRIRVPALQLANAGRQRTFVMLPPTAGNLTAEWTLRGLSAEALPANLAAKLGLERSPIAYRVQRERFVAEQRVFPDAMRSAAYRLAESRVAIGPDGAVSILAQLIVQAGGSDDCKVTLPAGAEMEHASVDGAVQRRSAGGGEAWPVPVGSRFLPRYLVISYRLPSSKLGKTRRFEPPQVSVDGKPLSPETTLWSIDDALGMKADESAGNSLSATAYAAAARQKQIDAFLDAYPLASQLAEWELQIWRQPWLVRLSPADAAVAAADPPAWIRLRERLANATPQRGASAVDPLRQWSQQNGTAVDYFSGAADGSVTLAPTTPAWPIRRWLAAATLAAAIGVVLLRPAALSNFALPAQRWPYAALGIAGGLWWLLLAPSWVGLVLAAFAIAAYWKSRK